MESAGLLDSSLATTPILCSHRFKCGFSVIDMKVSSIYVDALF